LIDGGKSFLFCELLISFEYLAVGGVYRFHRIRQMGNWIARGMDPGL
jgi:hypothetical protein